MKIAVDNNILAWILSDACRPPRNPDTGEELNDGTARLRVLKNSIASGDIEPLIIPMPAVAELFSVEDKAREKLLPILKDELTFTMEEFGLRAAIELGIVNNEYYATGDRRAGQEGTWAKIKADRQIYAIAKVCGADVMYTDDKGLTTLCESHGISVVHSWDMPLPDNPQGDLLDD